MNDELILSCCLSYVAPQTSRGARGVVLFTSDKVLGVKALVHQLQCATPSEWAARTRPPCDAAAAGQWSHRA